MPKHQSGNIIIRMLIALAVVSGVIAVWAIETARYSEIRRLRERTNVLEQDVRTAQEKADAALSAVIEPETLAKAQNSVYLIVVNGAARGTAFVIDRERGILAAAAHTATSLPLDEEDATVTILNRGSRKALNVQSVRLHAGFGAFRELVEDHQPMRGNSTIYSPHTVPLRDLAFDAALITVDPIDPETGENMLGPDLKIADEDALLKLEAGAPIAVIGYPFDTLDDGFASDAAIARVERGVIAAMTPPLDSVEENRDPVIANLIIHRLATAGGNSGSPLLNAAGEVIGIHTHGIVSPASNGDGAAQRAEVLYDLLDRDREETRLQETFFPSWKRILGHWSRAEEVMPWSFYMEYARPDEKPAPLVRTVTPIDPLPFDRVVERLNFEAETESRFVEASDITGQSSQSELVNGITRKEAGFMIKHPGQFAEIWRTVDRSRDHVIFAFDYSLRSTRGFCPLTGYYRKKGETRLRVMKSRASFELYLPASENVIEDYQIILRRRPKCDPLSDEFFVGSVSWPLKIQDAAQSVAFAPRMPISTIEGDKDGLLNHLGGSIHAFIKCRKPGGHKLEECQEPEFIELE
ncbi:trypsin-like peptidase domain-containing protein [Hyphococcus formosus]|uniref:trypsin-like peptidase domain-containing protein n=1 Tax=Hyphococcus formosus TaxID=3143534 RepID=UPI00398A7308